MEKPEKPGPDAASAGIAEWLEEDFWYRVTEGMDEADDEE